MAMSPRKRARVSRGIQYAVLAVDRRRGGAAGRLGRRSAEAFADPAIIAGMFPEVSRSP